MSFRLRLVFLLSLFAPFISLRADERVIIQFRQDPAVASDDASRGEDTLKRFREDLAGIAPSAAKRARPSILREYSLAFHGAAVIVSDRETLLALSRLPYVASVHPDREMQASATATTGTFRGAPAAIHSNANGSGVIVSIIDSGIDYHHPALGGGIGPGFKVLGGYDFVNDDSDPMDDNRHGTHVAGIVAANSATLSGVAPNASLLAYKVLNNVGRGQESDVLAAIERSLDPNGDGDRSDRAHVINMSLGAPGSPDDPVSQAVENAALAGVVVCASAGNDGEFHYMPSPAVARSAIAVGAIDGDGILADFSNRGPGAVDGAIKPDVVAPGVSIRSTVLNGQTALLTGTSMASPYVAGIAALLREAHSDWTPARIRAAIVNGGEQIADAEVMSQGAGRVSVARALASFAEVAPAQVNFGLYTPTEAIWTTTKTLTVTNTSIDAVTYRALTPTPFASVTLTAVPTEVAIPPGQSRTIEVSIRVDNATLGEPPSPSFSFGGVIYLQSDRGSLTVPWSFLKAARATVTSDMVFPGVVWISSGLRRKSFAITGLHSVETLIEPGTYDLAVVGSLFGDLRLLISENLAVTGNMQIEKRSNEAVHTIALDARDQNGESFPNISTETAHYFPHARLLLPPGAGAGSIELPEMDSKTIKVSPFSDRYGLLFTETHLDGAARRAFVAQHPPQRNVREDRTLRNVPADYRIQTLSLRFPQDSTKREVGILGRGMTRAPVEIGHAPEGLLQSVEGDGWSGTVFMTPDVHPDFASGVQFFMYSGHPQMQGLSTMTTPMMRLTSAGFVSALQFDPPPLPVSLSRGEALAYPSGAIYPLHVFSPNAQALSGTFEWQGQQNERRNLERASSMLRVRNSAGEDIVVATVPFGQIYAPLPGQGAYRATISSERYQLEGIAGRAEASIGFDTTRTDSTPATLTSLAILDSAGRHATRLPLHGAGTMVFSVADYEETPAGTIYRNAPLRIMSVFFRRVGNFTWTELPVEFAGEDTDASGRLSVGSIFHTPLDDALLRDGAIELRFEIVDGAGNDTTFEIAPAFLAEREASRHRPARR